MNINDSVTANKDINYFLTSVMLNNITFQTTF